MKICKTNKMKTLATVTIVVVFTFGACGNAQNKSADKETTKTEKEVKPPVMDIHTAAFIGNIDAIKGHIATGTDLNVKDQYGSTPLNIAATFGKTKVALALIEGGADLNITNNEGSTPLHTAAFFCRTEIVKALLTKGANKTSKNVYGSTALQSVSGPFEQVKPIYEQLGKQLGPLGLKLDLERIKETRPVIVEILQ